MNDWKGQPQQNDRSPYQGLGGTSHSQGWDQPRSHDGPQGHAPWQGAGQPGSAQAGHADFGQPLPGQHSQPGQPAQAKRGKKVGLGTALAMMLAGSVAAGSIVGVTVSNVGERNDKSTVNEVLNNQPVSNSTGSKPEAGSVEAVASKVLPAVVSIEVAGFDSAATGSGSIISPDGYVLTNHHVVAGAEKGGQLRVTLNDGTTREAKYVASDAATDTGIVKIDDAKDLPFLQFGNSDEVAVGQEVVAVGSPLGLNATVTSGIVSAKNRPVRASQEGGESSLIDAIQTDAAVNPGNSGGPLVDMQGNIVGMNSMIASLSQGGTEAGSIGLGFAIPSNFAKRMADQLINKGEVSHPTLGVRVDARSQGTGAAIVDVEPGGPADKAGLKAGDVVTRVNDRKIDNADALISAARSQDFGATVTLEVTNKEGDDPRQVEVTLSDE